MCFFTTHSTKAIKTLYKGLSIAREIPDCKYHRR
jgi:hypothetical protein